MNTLSNIYANFFHHVLLFMWLIIGLIIAELQINMTWILCTTSKLGLAKSIVMCSLCHPVTQRCGIKSLPIGHHSSGFLPVLYSTCTILRSPYTGRDLSTYGLVQYAVMKTLQNSNNFFKHLCTVSYTRDVMCMFSGFLYLKVSVYNVELKLENHQRSAACWEWKNCGRLSKSLNKNMSEQGKSELEDCSIEGHQVAKIIAKIITPENCRTQQHPHVKITVTLTC